MVKLDVMASTNPVGTQRQNDVISTSRRRHRSDVPAGNMIGRCKSHEVTDAVPLFEYTLCVNSLFGGSLAKFRGVHSLCTRPTVVHSSMNSRKMKFITEQILESIG